MVTQYYHFRSGCTNVLSSLNINKASGINGIGTKILSYCTISPFNLLVTLSIFTMPKKTYTLSSRLLAYNIPSSLYIKSGDKTLANNYLPMSLFCNTTTKVLEQLV